MCFFKKREEEVPIQDTKITRAKIESSKNLHQTKKDIQGQFLQKRGIKRTKTKKF